MDTRLRDKAYSDQIMIKNDTSKSSALKIVLSKRKTKKNRIIFDIGKRILQSLVALLSIW